MSKRIYYLIILFISFCAVQTHAQEICNNGIDDDADGLIDCFDPDCISYTASLNDPFCNGDGNGSITANPTAGTIPFTYQWGNNTGSQTTPSAIALTAGTYAVTITDSIGCTVTGYHTLNDPFPISTSITSVDETNFGACDGSISITVNGGVLPYSYSWNNGATSSSNTGLCSGIYSVTLTDDNGCEVILSEAVNGPGCMAQVDFNNWSQEGNPTYGNWEILSGGSVVKQKVNNQPTFFISPFDLINVQISGTIEVTTSEDNDYIGFVMGYNSPLGMPYDNYDMLLFDWKQGNQTSNCGIAGYEGYNLSIFNGIIPNNNCSNSPKFWGHIPDPPVFDVLAQNHGSTLGWQDNTPHYFTLFYTSSQITIQIDGDTIFDIAGCFQPGRFGFYNFSQEKVEYSNFSYQLAVDFKIPEPVICVNDTAHLQFLDTCIVNFNTGMVDKMTWDYGDGNTDIVNNPTLSTINSTHIYDTPGTYNVMLIVEDPSGCSDTAYQSITVSEAIANITTITNPLCFEDTTGAIDITPAGGTAPYSFAWSNGSTLEDISNLASGSYLITLTDATGCTDTANVLLTEPDELIVIATKANISCNGSFDGSIDLSVIGGTSPYLFDWSNGANTEDLSNISPGTYQVTVTDDNGCTDTLSLNITEPTLLVASATVDNNVSCFGFNDGNASVTASGGTTAYTYLWSDGTNTSSNTNLLAGTYSVTVTDANGCNVNYSLLIEEPSELIVITTTTDAFCWGSNDGTASLSISGGTGPYNIDWAGADTNALGAGTYPYTVTDVNGCVVSGSVTINDPYALSADTLITHVSCFEYSDGSIDLTVSDGTPPYTFDWSNGDTTEDLTSLSAGTYNLLLTDDNGCQKSLSIVIGQPALFEVDILGDTTLCLGDHTELTANNGDTFSWSTGETTQSINIQPADDITIWVNALENTCHDNDTVSITVYSLPIVSAGSDLIIDYGSSTTLNGSTTSSYLWTPDEDLSCNDCPNPSAMPEQDIIYYLESIDENGCTAIDSVYIRVIHPEVFIANIFSPNGDGRNDLLKVMGAKEDDFIFSIYDRWGNRVFESNNPENGWDGTIKGNRANPGVYVFTYGFKDTTGNTITGRGDVTIVR